MGAIETAIGRRFGDPADPLLVSVRSGAPVSMPGMMDTILNLGLTPETTGAFAAACASRGSTRCSDETVGAEVPDDPWAQLRQAIEAVFRSWNGDRARAYRAKEGIPDDLGTGGHRSRRWCSATGAPDSGTGVLFTRNPATGERALYGDVMFDAQGEDVVAGTHATEPIAVLDERLPAVAGELRAHADRLERHYADMCDIEFTIEDGRLWLLQVRVGKRSPQAALRIAVDMAEDAAFPLSRDDAVRACSAAARRPARARHEPEQHPPTADHRAAGLAGDRQRRDRHDARCRRRGGRGRAPGHPRPLGDVARRRPRHGQSAGILTAKGGLASHAAVVARGWGIPAVVGASAVQVGDRWVAIGDRRFRGRRHDHDRRRLRRGVRGRDPRHDRARARGRHAPRVGPRARHPDRRGGGPRPDPLPASQAEGRPWTTSSGRSASRASPLPKALPMRWHRPRTRSSRCSTTSSSTGSRASMAGAYRLTDTGTERASELVEAERTRWGAAADAALDAFLALDQRMKDIVTAWQLKEPDVVNDHTDPDYDRGVLDRLALLHADAAAFLDTQHGRLTTPRDAIGSGSAGRSIRPLAGDGRFVASPRVDSYHGVWFELHEDLIQLAGRTREDEVAAGRA